MSETADIADLSEPSRRRRHKRALKAGIAIAALLGVALGGIWFTREDIADSLIADTLSGYDLSGSYEIVSVGPSRQVLRNVVIGDPASPDMTIERAEVTIRYRFGLPAIGGVKLVRPRLYGRIIDGKVSFGALDRVIYAEPTGEPFRLPDLRLAINDGRALIRSEYGDIGVKAEGAGPLRGGFSGVVGAVAPRLTDGDCTASGLSLFGQIVIRGEEPHFEGPLRLGGIDCTQTDFALGKAQLTVDATGTRSLDGAKMALGLQFGKIAAGSLATGSLAGEIALSVDDNGLTSDIDVTAADIDAAGARLTRTTVEGALRSRDSFATLGFDGSFSGVGLRPGPGMEGQLTAYASRAEGTLLGPLLARMRGALKREGRGSTFEGEVQARFAADRRTVIMPHAEWQGAGGETLLSISRGQLTIDGEGNPRFAGHFQTGGPGMPRIAGRMERAEQGESRMQLSLAEYRAGDASLAIPALDVRQDASGTIRLNGTVRANGAIPGGQVANLAVPVTGGWSASGGLALWPGCVTPRFERLELASLTLQRQSLTLCAPTNSAILRSDGAGTRFAAGVPMLDLAGTLGENAARIRGGPVALGVPGTLVARDLDIALGPDERATRFRLSELTAEIGENIAGRIENAEFRLADVPLDITEASGDWAWRDGGLTIANGAIRVTDRQPDARFQPMVAQGVTLRFADNAIAANALMREATTGRAIVDVDIVHDLQNGAGHADLDVDGIGFDQTLQPDTVTRLALGTIANAQGTVRGTGRIDWNETDVTSTGRFSTDSLDFAAAFGPVRGLAGTVEFTDLLALETAPGQRVTLREINPGVVVENGVLDFAIGENLALSIHGGTWPFLGGTLRMRPTRMNLGVAEVRNYVFEIEGLDAALFIARMELNNLAATGTFDGAIPLVFDENGGRIEGGLLMARPPGGNVAYVGALTYEDMSPIANFAFDALKSLDYTGMSIALDGSLEGEIVTRVKIDGVSQGEEADKNFVTRRLASLPIRFDVNVRAPFYQLLSSFKSLYDPSSVRDPRELGLVSVAGDELVPSGEVVLGEDVIPAGNGIQPPASE